MIDECSICGVKNDVIPIEILYGMCKKCIRIQCFENIKMGIFQNIIESDMKKAQTMLEIVREFKERNDYEYQQIPELIRIAFEEYFKLLLWE